MNEAAREEIHRIIQDAVMKAGGNYKQSFREHVIMIETSFKVNWYIPEHSNIYDSKRAKIPKYDPDLVQRVGRRPIKFTPEQKAAAREVLRELGMI